MIRLDGALDMDMPGVGSRQDTGARQQRWMQELERAAFGARQAGASAPQQAAAARVAAAAPAGRDAASTAAHERGAPGAGAARAARPATLAPAFYLPLTAAVMPPPPGVAAFDGPGVVMPDVVAPEAADAGAAPSRAPAAPALWLARMQAGTAARAGQAQAAPPRPDAFAEPYAAAHMQLLGSADALHAYIRDARLAPAQAAAVGAAVAGAIASEGKRVGSVTVNGKAVALPDATAALTDQVEPGTEPGTAPPSRQRTGAST